jgi:hypothetical protein
MWAMKIHNSLARTPSHCNIVDKPSRVLVRELISPGFVDKSKDAKTIVSQLVTFMDKKVGKMLECSIEIPT